MTIWWQKLNFVFLSMKRWFQFNSRIVGTHFAGVMTLNNNYWEMITEMQSYIFRWHSRCCRFRVCVNSLIMGSKTSSKRRLIGAVQGKLNISNWSCISCSQNIVLFMTLNDRYAIMHCRACRAIGVGILGAKGGFLRLLLIIIVMMVISIIIIKIVLLWKW